MADPLLHHAESILHQLKANNLYRQPQEIESSQGPRIKIKGQEYVNFSSNDYLAMASNATIINTLITATGRFGLGSGASPLVCGKSTPHAELEAAIADFTGRDAALVFGSGYLANLGLATGFAQNRDSWVIQDRLCHASIIDGGLLARAKLRRYRHCDSESLEAILKKHRHDRKLVLTDAVFSMDGDVAPCARIAHLCQEYSALMAVDDAHGFGVLGRNGRGTLDVAGIGQDRVPLLLATFGKALGTYGAFVAGPDAYIEVLRQTARSYMYSTAMPPALAATSLESLRIVEQEDWRREKLLENIAHFKHSGLQNGLTFLPSDTPIQPLVMDSVDGALKLSAHLFEKGMLVVAIRPPTVPSHAPRLRITLTSAHTHEDIDLLIKILAEASP